MDHVWWRNLIHPWLMMILKESTATKLIHLSHIGSYYTRCWRCRIVLIPAWWTKSACVTCCGRSTWSNPVWPNRCTWRIASISIYNISTVTLFCTRFLSVTSMCESCCWCCRIVLIPAWWTKSACVTWSSWSAWSNPAWLHRCT